MKTLTYVHKLFSNKLVKPFEFSLCLKFLQPKVGINRKSALRKVGIKKGFTLFSSDYMEFWPSCCFRTETFKNTSGGCGPKQVQDEYEC